jgi:hypothetical protein
MWYAKVYVSIMSKVKLSVLGINWFQDCFTHTKLTSA